MTKTYDIKLFIWYLFIVLICCFTSVPMPDWFIYLLYCTLFFLYFLYNFSVKKIFLYQADGIKDAFEKYIFNRVSDEDSIIFFSIFIIAIKSVQIFNICLFPDNTIITVTLFILQIEILKKIMTNFTLLEYYRKEK